jgi:hypothetical protein
MLPDPVAQFHMPPPPPHRPIPGCRYEPSREPASGLLRPHVSCDGVNLVSLTYMQKLLEFDSCSDLAARCTGKVQADLKRHLWCSEMLASGQAFAPSVRAYRFAKSNLTEERSV